MDIEKAKKGLKRFCEYENSVVLTDNALYEYQEMIETVLQELENSINKDRLKEIINKYSYICSDGYTMMPKDCYENCIKDIIKLVNFKLLEDK